MLTKGDDAPDFQLLGTDGTDIGSYRLSDYVADGPVLLRFYPADFSAVCGDKLCEFRDTDWLTVNPEVTVFGISTDTVPAHMAFIDELDLNFSLLSDHNGTVSDEYGVCVEELAGHRIDGAMHACFVVDHDQRIRYAWSIDLPDIPDLESLRARWKSTEVERQPAFADIHTTLTELVGLPEEAFRRSSRQDDATSN